MGNERQKVTYNSQIVQNLMSICFYSVSSCIIIINLM